MLSSSSYRILAHEDDQSEEKYGIPSLILIQTQVLRISNSQSNILVPERKQKEAASHRQRQPR